MHCIVMILEERLLSMQQCFLSKLDIIPDKLDAVVAAMSYCDISNRPTASVCWPRAKLPEFRCCCGSASLISLALIASLVF